MQAVTFTVLSHACGRSAWRAAIVGPLLGVMLCACSKLPSEPVAIAPSGKLLLNGVNVVDTRNGAVQTDMSILMEQGKIVRIAAQGAIPADTSMKSIDARGKFVVPGYNDMHAHPLGPKDPSATLALMLANGITGFRQMQGSPELLRQRREHTLPLTREAPALLIMPGSILSPANAGKVELALATIREQKTQGADFIKVALVSPPVFFAALAEAKRLGLPFVGHLQQGVDAAVASKAGMHSIEHLGPGDTLLVSCSGDETALRAAVATLPPVKGLPFRSSLVENVFAYFFRNTVINPSTLVDDAAATRFRRILSSYDEAKCRKLAAGFVADNSWQVPTLIRVRTMQFADTDQYVSDPNLRYIAADTLKDWRRVTAKYVSKVPAATRETLHQVYALQMNVAKLFSDTGVHMLAGSDLGGGWVLPGFSLHQEFDELGKAGIAPLRILQMTTLNAADFLERSANMGTVEEGRNADLVLLDANPTESVQSLHQISGVVRAGYYYSRQDLNALLEKVVKSGGAAL